MNVLSLLRSFARPDRVLRICLGVALVVIAWACADKVVGPAVVTPKGLIGVYADLGPTGVTTLVIQASGPGIVKPDGSPDTLAFNVPLANGVASGSLDIPAGPDRVITARAFVGVTETHRGSVTTNILEGTNPTLHITMVPLVGNLPITVSIGSTIVTVRPLVASVSVNDTIRLTSEIRDHNGTLVSAKVRWATLNPNKATVDTNGLVTVKDTGDVQIVGTYGTVGGASKISGVAVASVAAIHLTWNGSVSTSWMEPNNWTPHGLGAARVPTLADSVVIPAAAPRMPVLNCDADNKAVRDIVIEPGAQLTSSCFRLNVYGSAVAKGPIPTVNARPNARLAGAFGDIFIVGGGVQLIDSVSANFVSVEQATGTFSLNHHTLRTVSDFNVSSGATVTMVDGDTLIIGNNSNWSGGDHTGLLTGGVVFARGTSFHGARYFGTGTSRLVFDRTGSGLTTLSGFDFVNNPTNSQVRRLEIKSKDGVTTCGAHIRVMDTLSIVSTGTPSAFTTCSSYQVRVFGPVITGANTDVSNYLMDLRHPTGTSLVAGTWHPEYTDFNAADQAIKPTLAYNNLRFFARNALPANVSITGFLSVNGSNTELDFAGHKLQVANYVELLSSATLKMANAADSLVIGEHLNVPSDAHGALKPKLSAGVITIGAYLEGTGFATSGTKVVMTGTSASTNKYINSVNYESRPTQEIYDLEIAAGVTYGLCARVRVTHLVTVKAGARLNDWCGGPVLWVQGDLVSEAASTVDPSFVVFNTTVGTSHIGGVYAAGETQFLVANAVIQPGLNYQNMRVLAPTQLTGTTALTGFLIINGAASNLTVNGQTLTIGNFLQVENNGTLTMNNPADVVTVKEYGNFSSDNSTAHNTRLTAGTLSIGAYLEGTGFSASGTHTLVMTNVSANTNKYINSLNYESRPAQGIQNLEIAAGVTYGLCARVAVKGTLTVRAGATLQNWCTQPFIRLDGNLVTEAGSNMTPYNVILNSAFGTDNVLGTFSPTYTTVNAAAVAGHIKPGLAYQNFQFFAPVSLNGDLAVNGELNVDGAAAVLNLNGHALTVSGNLNMRSSGTIVMQNAADVLDVSGNASWNGGGNESGKLTNGTTTFRGDNVCGTNYETSGAHVTVFDRPTSPVRYTCVSSSSTAQLLTHVQVKGLGLALECNMNVSTDIEVFAGATVKQNCSGGTLYVGQDLVTATGSALTNGSAYPSSQAMSVVLGNATGTQHVSGAYDPHITYFTAVGSFIKPNSVGGVAYRHMRIDQSSSFIGTTELAGGLEVINSAIVDLGGNTVTVRGSMDLNNGARLKMVSANDTLIVGLDDPAADLNWDAGDNSTDGSNPLLTNGAVKFYGDNFRGSQYKAQLSTRHRFIFASPSSGNVSLEGSPRFANLEIRTPRPVVNNSSLTVVQDSLMMGANTSYGGNNQLQILGELVTQAASDLSVQTIFLDGANGTASVGGRFRPTTVQFRSATPATNAIKTGLEYQNVVFQNGQFQLNGATTTAFDVDISTNARLIVNGQSLTVGGGMNVNNTAGLVMAQSTDAVTVAGTFQGNGGQVGTVMSGGTLTVSGNFNQFENIIASGTHKVVLTGAAAKSVSAFNNASRQFMNLDISGTGSVNLNSGVYVGGDFRVLTPVTVTGSTSSTSVIGDLSTVAGSSFTATNLNLFGANGTDLVNGTLTVTGTLFFGGSTQTIKAGAGLSYANLSVSSASATVSGGVGLTVPGTLTVTGTLAVPTGSSLNTVNVNAGGTINFLGTSVSTGILTVNSGAAANANTDLGTTAYVDFARILLHNGGTMDNGARTLSTTALGGFRYKTTGATSGFQNNNPGGGFNGVTGTTPFANQP